MAAYYGTVPLRARIDIGGYLTDEEEARMEKDENLFEVFASAVLGHTEDSSVDYEVEYEGDGSFSLTSNVRMFFDAGYIPARYNSINGGDPPDAWCDMDDSGYRENEIVAEIASGLPDYLKGRTVKIDTDFDERDVDLGEPYNPFGDW